MRLFSFSLLGFLFTTLAFSHPLAFEKRGESFYARDGGTAAAFEPDRVSLGPVTLRFPGSSPQAHIEGVGPSSSSSYISPNGTKTFPQFPKLAIRGLYPGIDAIFYGNSSGDLEYDLSIAPGSSPSRVRLSFEGARAVSIDDRGNLTVETIEGILQQKVPRVFQSKGRQVSAHYVLLSEHEVGIRIGSYDTRSALTIDPELVYQKYFGGTGADRASAIATDAQGNIYMAGVSNSVDFPGTDGFPTNADPPLFALTNSGSTVTPIYVGREDSVLSFGGTSDGKILYALTSGGMYLSSDSGASWVKNSPLPSPNTGYPFNPANIGNIAVDPISPSSLLVPTNSGLYFSHDTGRTWFLSDSGFPSGQNGTVFTTQAIISPLDHQICYAVAGNPSMALFKSKDACNTWLPLNDSYPGEPPAQQFPYSQTVMALGPNGSDLYVVDGNATLLKSTDGGGSWQGLAQGLFSSQALIVDPSNASNIYVLNNYGVQMSKDGGATFSTIVPRTLPGASQPSQVQAMAWDPATSTLYISIQSIVYFTKDSGATLHVVPQVSTGNLHALVNLGGRVFVAVDAPPRPFVMKLDPTGSHILYSTFFGGGWADGISALKVDSQGNVYVAGTTLSTTFPATAQLAPNSPAGQFSSFVVKLSPDGTRLIYASELSLAGGVNVQAMALDSAGSVYITGQASSKDYPTTQNSFEPAIPATACPRPQNILFFLTTDIKSYAFVSKLRPDGSAFVYSTFLTGSCGSIGQGIAIDPAGEAIVTGNTTSPDFPITSGTYQSSFPGDPANANPLAAGFITKLSAAGDKVLASTYLGGGYSTQVAAVALDAAGNVFATGTTNGIAPGATPGAYQTQPASGCAPTLNIGPGPPPAPPGDAFLLKLNPALTTPRFLTYLGGACNDVANALAVDASGNTWLLGSSGSSDFPLLSPFQEGLNNQFITELDANGSHLLFSSYVFSSYTNAAGLTLDPTGAVLLAGADVTPTIPKTVAVFGTTTSAVLVKIDPAAKPTVQIDSVFPVTPYAPPTVYPTIQGIAPGQLIQITGHNLGPATKVDAKFDDSGRLQDIVANVMVKFDGLPAPLISVQDGLIQCFAPFEISQSAVVTVTNGGQVSNPVRIGVTGSNPQILTILNPDGTLNSKDHPAKAGSVITLYVSGLGITTPLSLDGLVSSFPLPVPVAPVTVFLPGGSVPLQFVGAAPGLISGITQINFQIPAGTPANAFVSISVASAPLYVSP